MHLPKANFFVRATYFLQNQHKSYLWHFSASTLTKLSNCSFGQFDILLSLGLPLSVIRRRKVLGLISKFQLLLIFKHIRKFFHVGGIKLS